MAWKSKFPVQVSDSVDGDYATVPDAELTRVPGPVVEKVAVEKPKPKTSPCPATWTVSSGWHQSAGEDFEKYFRIKGILVKQCPLVVFCGFAFDFGGAAHHEIDYNGVWVFPVRIDRSGTPVVVVRGGLRGKNDEDPYEWKVFFQIVEHSTAG